MAQLVAMRHGHRRRNLTWQTLREVVEEIDVSDYVDSSKESHPRLDEAWESLKWLLARNPEPKGSALKVTARNRYRAFVLAGDFLARTPDIGVVYIVSDTQINILEAVVTVPPEEDVDEE